MTTDSISGKTVFVTGADGFIGSHLVELLVASGARVRAMTYYNSWNEKGWLRDVPAQTISDIELFAGDIRDAERVRQGVRGCDYVFHLSSLIAIPYSYDAPRSYVETNVIGALNLPVELAERLDPSVADEYRRIWIARRAGGPDPHEQGS